MSSLALPSEVRNLPRASLRRVGTLVPLSCRRNWLNRDDDVPITYPALSKPRTHFSLVGRTPPEKLEPRYSVGTKPYVVGSQVPNSQGLNSYTVAFEEMTVSPGARPSATMIGMGQLPLVKSDCNAIEDQVYAGPPSVALMSWNDKARPLRRDQQHGKGNGTAEGLTNNP